MARAERTKAIGQMSRFHTGNEKGFTLLEILLAFFIFAIIFITIYTTYSGSFKTITQTESRMELYRKAAITLEKISEDIQASYISILPQGSFGNPAEYTRFLGKNDEINGRDADTLHFFATLPPLFDDHIETASGLLIAYDVVQGSSDDELILLRSENQEFLENTDERGGLVLCDGLQAINFSYFDTNGDVHDSWDSDSEDFDAYLPSMVMIELEFLNPENPDSPFQFSTSIALPLDFRLKLYEKSQGSSRQQNNDE